MGGAFVGLADDWSAGFWNPAGFAFLKNWGVGQSVDFISLRALDNNSIANPTPPLTRANIEQGDPFFQLGGEPSQFGVTDTTIQAALPSAAGYGVWGPWAFSAGVFSPLGFAYDWDDRTIPGYHAHYKSQGYVIEYNLSAARRWGDKWALGLGVNFLDTQLKRDALKETPSYAFASSADGRGHAVQGVVGLLAHLHERLSLGMVYKTGTDIRLDGTATVLPGIGGMNNETSPQVTTIYNPATYSVGLAFHATTNWVITSDWEGTDWRPTPEKVEFAQQGMILQNQDFNAGWRFTNRIRIGTECAWQVAEHKQMVFRAGYTRDPSSIPDSAVSMTNLVDVSRDVYTTGMGWHWGSWEPEIGFAYATGSRNVGSVVYKKVDRLLSIGLQYKMR
jgi:long-chain fatty acid transport protein